VSLLSSHILAPKTVSAPLTETAKGTASDSELPHQGLKRQGGEAVIVLV